MIEIIKHGTKQVTKCRECGCGFSYEEEDIQGCSVKTFVECPQCKKEIVLKAVR